MKQRILTGVIAAALFLPIVYFGGLPFVILTYLLASIGLYELFKMKKLTIFSPYGFLSLLFLWVLLFPPQYEKFFNEFYYSKTELGIACILLLLAYTVITKNRFTFEEAAFSLLSAIYVGIGFYFFMEVREAGLVYILYSLFLIWATDSGAYFVGKAMGKKKLWPEISPNKTVEGSIGGIVCAVLVAVIFSLLTEINATTFSLIGITIVLSMFGQIGDLVQSAYKRHFGVKDSGNILPGHGGILDRFDSLLFVLPLLHFFHLW
ncbi:phosphatidate cytidylyltransferase [Neobacillus thermocopriae]|uniref:Phosphatidate cytidylyltransferase n=1 Tax=Neobacillus thermocopriae TaxID=1215031 RepID=A0A6B3TL68_9BACI|nr:phosphatidate cytidylyltransferase [Neobacillus thermocopriae]MED3624230.1 phosphatidate cytidylyltransferase [Neobacillus thermocopriae]MED3713575.1 phosphatidate cytidylyltransferase [Neobacillus thermocopriae]NEX77685.1 phosphatidate cytidylyltransferase [Neobacillus thermocopriae]